jgi:hypothetical protein
MHWLPQLTKVKVRSGRLKVEVEQHFPRQTIAAISICCRSLVGLMEQLSQA